MISWRERKHIAEEAALRDAAARTARRSWWTTPLAVLNSPIVLAVVVSSILGFFTETYRRSEACFADLANANRYWLMLDAELVQRTNEKMRAVRKAPDDIRAIIKAFADADLPERQHVTGIFRDKLFLELLISADEIRKAFRLPNAPSDATVFIFLSEVAGWTDELSNEQLLDLLAQLTRDPTIKKFGATELRDYIDVADSNLRLALVTQRQLPYNCRWLAVAKRELLTEESPFSTGALPRRSD